MLQAWWDYRRWAIMNGVEYFVIKNSWGQGNPYGGRQYISKAYFKAKTIAVTMHKDAMTGGKR